MVQWNIQILFIVYRYSWHGSESWGQERAKRIAKNKMCDELPFAFYMSECSCNNNYVTTGNLSDGYVERMHVYT